jgi:hypothetical protein
MRPARGEQKAWWRSILRIYLWCLAALAFVVGVSYGGTWWWLREEERAWSREVEPTRSLLDRHPEVETNATARRLEQIARPLGIDFGESSPSKASPDVSAVLSWTKLEELALDDDQGQAPAEVQRFLAEHAGALSAARDLLATSEPPRWARNVSLAYSQPTAPAAALRQLHALFLGAALDADRRGETAEPWLEAARRSSADLSARPDFISSVTAAGLERTRSGIVRRLSRAHRSWFEGPDPRAFRRALTQAYHLEAYTLGFYARGLHGVAELEGPRASGVRATLLRWATAPYVRASVADSSSRMRALARELRDTDPCHLANEAREEALGRDIPRWNILGRWTLRPLQVSAEVIAHSEVESELTRLVVEARYAGEPGLANTDIASAVCSGVVWERRQDPDGSMRVEATNIELKRADGLPWRYRWQVTPRARAPQPG